MISMSGIIIIFFTKLDRQTQRACRNLVVLVEGDKIDDYVNTVQLLDRVARENACG